MLRQLRRSKGATVKELAQTADVSPSYLFRLERGEAPNPSIALLRRLAAALEVQVETLTEAGRAPAPSGDAALANEIAAGVRTLSHDDLELIREVVRLLLRRSRRQRLPTTPE